MTYRCILFAAVSTEAQATEDRASLDTQLEQCRAVCTARGWHVVGELRVEGHSRNYDWLHEIIRDCPAYGDLIRQIEADTADLVVVRDYDRLWRTDALRAQVTALCRQHHVQVFSANQPVEPVASALLADSDSARLNEVLFGYIAEQENRTRARRAKVGMQARARRGLYCSAIVPWGYLRDRTLGLVPDPVAAPWVRWVFERRAEGWGYRAIAEELARRGVRPPASALWQHSAVATIVSNPTYIGRVRWGEIDAPGQHPPLIDADLWARAQAVNANRSAYQHSLPREPRALARLCRCGACGWALGYVRDSKGHLFLRCNQYGHDWASCSFGCTSVRWVEAEVLARVQAAMRNPDAWADDERERHQRPAAAARLAAIDAQLAEVRGRYARWDALYESGGITANELLLHRQQLLGQAQALERDRAELVASAAIGETAYRNIQGMAAQVDTLAALPVPELRAVYGSLIRRVTVYKPRRLEIDWL